MYLVSFPINIPFQPHNPSRHVDGVGDLIEGAARVFAEQVVGEEKFDGFVRSYGRFFPFI